MEKSETKLIITEFGNPILRKKAKRLDEKEIQSQETAQLIASMRSTVQSGEFGVGLAAPQVGKSVALSVILIRPTSSHPGRERYERVIINPKYKGYGEVVPMWEGCMSFTPGNPAFAQALRYKEIDASWQDEHGILHEEQLKGFVAHVFQHEVDHLNGVLFVDKIADSKSWMTANEYKKCNKDQKK